MVNIDILNKLIKHKASPAVSIFIPTNVVGDYEVNRIRWKNELDEVYSKLEANGHEKTSFLQQAKSLLDNQDFWANQSAGLAGYFSEDHYQIINLVNPIKNQNYLSDIYVTSPLILNKLDNQRVFLLAISQNKVRFFEAVNAGIYPVKTNDLIPKDMATALYLDIQKETLHSSGTGKTNTNHFKDKQDIRIEQYLRSIDEGLWPILVGEKIPLVLSCVEEYHAMYKDLTRYKNFSNHIIAGNPDTLSAAELRMQMEPIFEDLKTQEVISVSERIERDYKKENFTDQLEEISYNAEINNIDTLLVPDTYIEKDGDGILELEQILRSCLKNNVPVSIHESFENVAAVTRNGVIQEYS